MYGILFRIRRHDELNTYMVIVKIAILFIITVILMETIIKSINICIRLSDINNYIILAANRIKLI